MELRQAGETWEAIAEEFVEYAITMRAVSAIWYQEKNQGNAGKRANGHTE